MVEILGLCGIAFMVATLILPNAGEVKLLENFVNKTAPQDLELRLYQNNITPAETDTAATYTQATFTGYAAVTLTGATWSVASGAPSEASYPIQSFLSSADQAMQQLFGYYVVGGADGVLRWAERFTDGPYPVSNLADEVRVTPKFTGD